MRTAAAIFTFLASILSISHALETLVLDLDAYCSPISNYASRLAGPANRLSFDEYKGYVNELISIYPDPFDRGNIYEEIDLGRNETSMELRTVFDELANEVCQGIFQDSTQTICNSDSIQVFDGISDLSVATVNEEVAFMFTVCERSVQFLIGQVQSDSPSMAPSYSGELSFSNKFQVEAIISKELRDEGKEPTLETAGNSLIRALESYTKTQSWDYIENRGDDELVDCGIQFFDRVILSSEAIACPVRRSTFSDVSFAQFQCFRYSIQTNVRISSDSTCIERRDAIAESLKKRFDNAFRSGELNTFLCTDNECNVLTFVETGRDWALPLAFGVTGAVFLTFACFTCRNKSKAQDDDSMSSAAIQVEFPVPKLPRDDEPIQTEQKVPIAI